MEPPLWIDRHQPDLEALPQEELRRYLAGVPDGPVNLLLHGPAGAGKTAAIQALAEELHAEPELDLLTINVADFFGMTKSELVEDPRFRGFIAPGQRQDSKASLINHILKEMAGYQPVSGDFKTIVLDNAEAMREDFQQALRRVMEQHYEATQFILATRRVGGIIPPIRSRCVQVPVRAPTTSEITAVLADIATAEEVPFEGDGLAYVAEYADGDLRQAILALQVTAEEGEPITPESAYRALEDLGPSEEIITLLEEAERGNFSDARTALDRLLIQEGFDGGEVLEELLAVASTRYEPSTLAAIQELAGEIEFDMTRGTSDRVHLGHLVSQLEPLIPGE